MTQNITNYLAFIGIYILIWFTVVVVPYEIDSLLAVTVGLLAMISVFIVSNRKYRIFDDRKTYYFHLFMTFIIMGLIALYDFVFGLTEIIETGINSVRFQNSIFYEYSLGAAHASLLGSFILLIYSLLKRNFKNALIGVASIALFAFLISFSL